MKYWRYCLTFLIGLYVGGTIVTLHVSRLFGHITPQHFFWPWFMLKDIWRQW